MENAVPDNFQERNDKDDLGNAEGFYAHLGASGPSSGSAAVSAGSSGGELVCAPERAASSSAVVPKVELPGRRKYACKVVQSDQPLFAPHGLCGVPGCESLLIADTNNHCIWRFEPGSGVMTKVAGSSTRGFAGDGGPAVSAKLSSPADVVVHPSKNVIYIADGQNHRVRAVENGVITTVAGRRKRRGTVDMNDGIL